MNKEQIVQRHVVKPKLQTSCSGPYASGHANFMQNDYLQKAVKQNYTQRLMGLLKFFYFKAICA